jgi:PAS domain S-box-containing protein
MDTGSPGIAKHVHRFDWSKTPLGPMERWPQSLRIAAGICLNSRFPMFIWWGPQLIYLYNEAHFPILGARHPSALGRSARDVWSEVWEALAPQVAAVMGRGEATWNENVHLVLERNGYPEDTYHTWSYSPIYDEGGAIGGIFGVSVEETPRVAAIRQRDELLAEIQSARARLMDAFGQSPAFLALLLGPSHRFEFVNERYLQLVGHRDVLGQTVAQALPEVVEQGFTDILDRVYSTGESFIGSGMRVDLQREANGPLAPSYVDFVYQAMRAADGSVTGILVHGVDVTVREQAEARDRFLLTLEDGLRSLDNPREITIAGATLLGEYLGVDRCAYAEVSADQQEFDVVGDYNRGVPSIVGRYRMLDFGAEWTQCLLDGVPYVVTDVDTHLPSVGDLAPYRATRIQAVVAVPMHKAGKLVAAMAVHQSRVRAWNAAEVELLGHVASRCWESIERARVERTLRESESNFRELADAMPQIVFAADAEGRVDYFNRQWYEYTGLPEGDAGVESWKQVHTPEGFERAQLAWFRSLAAGEPYELEYPLRRHDGELRWHLGRALPIRDASGRVVRWFGTNTDIHDRKQIEDALNHALEAEQRARSQAENASRMKDEFLATLSHELRTPLNAILGWAHIIRRENAKPEELARGADVIERNAHAQATIIDDLLDMSAIISGKVRLNVAAANLPAILAAAVETAQPAADAREIRIGTALDTLVGVDIRGDPDRLQQVFWNLLSNAIKFTPRRGHIEVTLAQVNSHVEVSVADSGEGIKPEFLPFVFDRFRQADATTTRRHGGLGLGLSIVKQLVELHGGAIRVRSEGEGKGARFTVSLPLFPILTLSDSGERRRRADTSSIQPVTPVASEGLAGVQVLVVDDDADARELARRILENYDARVWTASSAASALELIGTERFDVIVSDIGMPGMDGHALIRAVRALPEGRGAHIPAVALTAYARPEDRVMAIRAGFQAHATKPVEPANLVAIIASLAKTNRSPEK